MRTITFEESESYKVAILIKNTGFYKDQIRFNYVDPLDQLKVETEDVLAVALPYGDKGKINASFIKEQLDQILPELQSLGVKFLYVADSAYFKVLAGQTKAEPHFGYVFPCKVKGYEAMQVVLGLNHGALIYNPELQAKLTLSLNTLASVVHKTYQPLGQDIIHSARYPEGPQAIAGALESLHQYPSLTCDIEGFSLRFNEAGIGTIGFAWDQHNGLAFACDYNTEPANPCRLIEGTLLEGVFDPDPQVRILLKEFFTKYQGELTFHKADYDLCAIIYALWMKTPLDTEGLLEGLEVMTKRFHDTKLIAYLATNSTAGNVLGLKALAHEFAGNWAVEEIRDIRKIPLPKLLQYNLVDCLSTHYVRNKYYPVMVNDQQEELYKGLMLSSLRLIIQLELTGMPLDPAKVQEVKAKLEAIRDGHLDTIQNAGTMKIFNLLLRQKEWEKDFEDRKSKAKNPHKIKPKELEAFDSLNFNPNSGPQLQKLFYELMGLPVLDLTDTKQPATGAETIEKLINHTQVPAYKEILEALIGYGKAEKVLSTFIPAFEQAINKGDGIVWLHGSFNLGGTVSGRLSSSDPNLQNLPANSIYGKLIKECFVGPVGWLFCGADFNSLEDYISALTTKDKNKLAVYEQGFDGHCLRAAYYFRDQLPHIDLTDPKSVNTIKKTHPELRQDSKPPTFLLTYGGTYHGMMHNLGWSEEQSKRIEANYHELYKESDEYIQSRLAQASKDGFATVAFGLRVRTPLLAQVIWGTRIPYEAQAEARTVGNAMGQSYGLLNNRAAVDFMNKVWASPYRLDIRPIGLIHDSIYLIIRDRDDVVEWANRELIASMKWQDLPEIQHPTVHLGANLDIFWPNWSNQITLPNDASRHEIRELAEKGKRDYAEKMQKMS